MIQIKFGKSLTETIERLKGKHTIVADVLPCGFYLLQIHNVLRD